MDNNQENNKKGPSLTEYGVMLMVVGVVLESLRQEVGMLWPASPSPFEATASTSAMAVRPKQLLCHGPHPSAPPRLRRKPAKLEGIYTKSIAFVLDRLGHDRRYAMDDEKIEREFRMEFDCRFQESNEKYD